MSVETEAQMGPINMPGKYATEELKSSVAMVLALVSFSMLFATLFLGYALFRVKAPTWPPMGMPRLPVLMPSLSSFSILFSSYAYVNFQKHIKYSNFSQAKVWIYVTFIAGTLFLALQFGLWDTLKAAGLYAGSGVFSSMLYAFTWIHAAHLFAGLMFLAWFILTYRKWKTTDFFIIKVKNIGKFWHFLGIVWFAIYFSLFVF